MEKEKYISPEIKIILLGDMESVFVQSASCNGFWCGSYSNGGPCTEDYCDGDSRPGYDYCRPFH